MSNVIPIICVGMLVIVAPLLKQQSNKITDKSEGVINSEFVITVEDKLESKNGLANCKFLIKDLNKQVMGPCKTTSDLELVVGSTYTINRAKLDGGFISINKAQLLNSSLKWEVVETFVRARTPLMKIKNGEIEKLVGNESGYSVGDLVSSN